MRENFLSLQFKDSKPNMAVLWTGDFREEKDLWLAECMELGTATYAPTLDEARTTLVEAVLLQLGEVDKLGFIAEFLRDHGMSPLRITPPTSRTSSRGSSWRSPVPIDA